MLTGEKVIRILGIRGIPAKHGGFETFAERLASYLVKKGWDVTVYCQHAGTGLIHEEWWNSIRLIRIPARSMSSGGSLIFDWLSTRHAVRQPGLILTLGYNTAVFSLLPRIYSRINVINMDGLEWKRKKWPLAIRMWLLLNERIGSKFGNHLIADHPEIREHLASFTDKNKITVISYGADKIVDADQSILKTYNLEPFRYCLVIARPEPENSIEEIVTAFSKKKRGMPLVILGNYNSQKNHYHRVVQTAASEEVRFIGAIYNNKKVQALRLYNRLYIHGHQVGGTNPSLVEALGAGSPILAHDNRFNRWVAGSGAKYFQDTVTCTGELDRLLDDESELKRMRQHSWDRHAEEFTWEKILESYERLLTYWLERKELSPKLIGLSKYKSDRL